MWLHRVLSLFSVKCFGYLDEECLGGCLESRTMVKKEYHLYRHCHRQSMDPEFFNSQKRTVLSGDNK